MGQPLTPSTNIPKPQQKAAICAENPKGKALKLGQWRPISATPQRTILSPQNPRVPGRAALLGRPQAKPGRPRAPSPEPEPEPAAPGRASPESPAQARPRARASPGTRARRPPSASARLPRSPGPTGPAPAPLTARAQRRPGRETPAARERERGDERACARRRRGQQQQQQQQQRWGRLSRRPELRLQLPGAGGAFSAESRRRERGRPLSAALGGGRAGAGGRSLWALPGRRGQAGSAAVPQPRLWPAKPRPSMELRLDHALTPPPPQAVLLPTAGGSFRAGHSRRRSLMLFLLRCFP